MTSVVVHNDDSDTAKIAPVAGGSKDHFVTAKGTGDVILKANLDPSDSCDAITWEASGGTITSPGVGSDKCTAKVSRDVSKKVLVSIKCKDDTLWEGIVWIVWSTIAATPKSDEITDSGTSLNIKMGYDFEHTISPAEITDDTKDVPDLKGSGVAVPPPGGLNYKGDALTGGANKKWDVSRAIRQKFINPSGIPLSDIPGDPSFHTTYPDYPNTTDGDGRPGGAGAISADMVPLVGNDDASTLDPEDNDPYTAPNKGKLTGEDKPNRVMLHSKGANGDTVEWRLHFIEFTRLDIGGTWYRISDDFPWRLHFKMKKDSGKWTNDGSSKALNNSGF